MCAISAKIAPFPGAACDFHQAGRCLYEERLNPGLDRALRCTALAACEDAFDGFLTQADNFGLSDARALAIWENRLAKLTAPDPDCGQFAPDPEAGYPGCIHYQGDLCLLRLPGCGGVCDNYRRKRKTIATTSTQSDTNG